MNQIVKAIKERQLVIFAGAGISKDAGLPDWVGFGCQLYERLSHRISENYKDMAKQLLCNKQTIPNGIDFLFNFATRLDVGNEIREKARKAITSRTQRLSFAQEYKEASQEVIAEIDSHLGEKIKVLEKQLADTEKNSSEEVSHLKQEIENLKTQLKRRKRNKERHQKRHKRK